jgi:hypothetical protein
MVRALGVSRRGRWGEEDAGTDYLLVNLPQSRGRLAPNCRVPAGVGAIRNAEEQPASSTPHRVPSVEQRPIKRPRHDGTRKAGERKKQADARGPNMPPAPVAANWHQAGRV